MCFLRKQLGMALRLAKVRIKRNLAFQFLICTHIHQYAPLLIQSTHQ